MPTSNEELAARSYQKQFRELLQAVFNKQAYFRDFFGGQISAMDGVQHNENAFYVKTSDIPVVVGNDYDASENTAFGTGTANSSRFGERTEIIYTDTPVPYTWEWVYHEGIDRHTVNNNFDAAVADRLELQAQAKVKKFNQNHSAFISNNAGVTKELTGYSDENVTALFDELYKHYLDNEVAGTKIARVNAELYNTIVNGGLATAGKGSSVDIDQNEVSMFKDFVIQPLPSNLFQNGDVAYVYVPNVAKAFTGINTSRTIESEDFDGVALQGAGKAGEFMLEDNKAAVAKVTFSGSSGGETSTQSTKSTKK